MRSSSTLVARLPPALNLDSPERGMKNSRVYPRKYLLRPDLASL
jgi:hypothetical protein